MVYSLSDGLTALGAYGIIIIANTNLCSSINERLKGDSKKHASVICILLYPILGIAFLSSFLGYIIINSEVIMMDYLKFYIGMALWLTIIINHGELFSKINSYLIKEKTLDERFSVFIWVIWGIIFPSFMYSPNNIKASAMFFFMLFPIISEYVINPETRLDKILIKAKHLISRLKK
jgi:hypothetical protein